MNKIMLICQPCVKNTETKEKRGCRKKAGVKRGVLRVVICFCKSSVTVGTKGGYYYMPSPAGKGDREAVDEESFHASLREGGGPRSGGRSKRAQ